MTIIFHIFTIYYRTNINHISNRIIFDMPCSEQKKHEFDTKIFPADPYGNKEPDLGRDKRLAQVFFDVLEARRRGVPCTVFRPGRITGDSPSNPAVSCTVSVTAVRSIPCPPGTAVGALM